MKWISIRIGVALLAFFVTLIEGALWCQRADGTIHQFLVNDSSEYGSFFKSITSSHSTWALENLDFVRTISNGKSAKDYVATHRWSLLY